MVYSGIDLHRRLIVICTIDQEGATLARASMKNDPMQVATYFRQWTDEHHAVVECTGNWYWFCDLLRSLGIKIVLAHAKYLKAISYAKVVLSLVLVDDSSFPVQFIKEGCSRKDTGTNRSKGMDSPSSRLRKNSSLRPGGLA